MVDVLVHEYERGAFVSGRRFMGFTRSKLFQQQNISQLRVRAINIHACSVHLWCLPHAAGSPIRYTRTLIVSTKFEALAVFTVAESNILEEQRQRRLFPFRNVTNSRQMAGCDDVVTAAFFGTGALQ